MRDRALNERAVLPFPCLIGKLCRQVSISPNRSAPNQDLSRPDNQQDAQLIQRDVLAAKKELKDEMRKKLVVLKDMMDGLENLVHDRFQAAGSVDTEEFKSQLAEMRTQVAKLAEKQVQERRQEKKTRKASRKVAREKESLEQPQRDAVLVGDSSSGAAAPVSSSQPDHVLSFESAPVNKGADVELTTGA
uniref:Integrase core domain containing protein n=1 Tax=Solanum tuberosum TaxID=4113 RepID=M1DCZ3_SOLTU